MSRWILNEDGDPVLCEDLLTWAEWFERADRQVALDRVGPVTISTAFIGLDMSFGVGPPVLFETAVFAGLTGSEILRRYRTRLEALIGHEAVTEEVRAALPLNESPKLRVRDGSEDA